MAPLGAPPRLPMAETGLISWRTDQFGLLKPYLESSLTIRKPMFALTEL